MKVFIFSKIKIMIFVISVLIMGCTKNAPITASSNVEANILFSNDAIHLSGDTQNSIAVDNVENIKEDIEARVLWIKEHLDTFTCVQGELYKDYYDGNDLVYRSFYQFLDSQSLSSSTDSDEYILYFDESGNLIYSDITHYRGPMYSIYFHENMLLHTEVGPFHTGGTFVTGSLSDVENVIKEDSSYNFIMDDVAICLENKQ